jgi:hypothetical protein
LYRKISETAGQRPDPGLSETRRMPSLAKMWTKEDIAHAVALYEL